MFTKEALALTIHDIDLKNKRLNIHRTLTTYEKGNIIIGIKVLSDFLIFMFVKNISY